MAFAGIFSLDRLGNLGKRSSLRQRFVQSPEVGGMPSPHGGAAAEQEASGQAEDEKLDLA
jgi:hypothetical protein